MLIVGRFINGISVGICSAQVPVYVSELAKPSRRGLVVGTQQWAITWLVISIHTKSSVPRFVLTTINPGAS
jgi:MFS family permease